MFGNNSPQHHNAQQTGRTPSYIEKNRGDDPGKIRFNTQKDPDKNAKTLKEKKRYLFHNDIQAFSNMLQKLCASGSDLATNTKLMDVSDADYRMLPFEVLKTSFKYALGIKLSFLIFFGLTLPYILSNKLLPLEFAYSFTYVFVCVFIYWGAHILFLNQQYVLGDKTGRYFHGLRAGWRVVDTTYFLSFVAFSALLWSLFTYEKDAIEFIRLSSTWKLHSLGQFISVRAESFLIALKHLCYFAISSSILYKVICILTLKKGLKLQKENKRMVIIDHNRQEVADDILKKRA